MRPEKKAERYRQQALDLLKREGIDTSHLEQDTPTETKGDVQLKEEAILLYIEDRSVFVEKTCKGCKKKFVTTWQYVSYCDQYCRRAALESLGIRWHAIEPGQRLKARGIPIAYTVPSNVYEGLNSV